MRASKSIILTPFIFMLILALNACALSKPATDKNITPPAAWLHANQQVANEKLNADWWRSFGSTELNQLIVTAQESNLNLETAVARIEQAHAQAKIAGAILLPEVGFNLDATRQDNINGRSVLTGESYSAALSASYEIDFWGGNRARRDSALSLVKASQFNYDVVRLSLQSSVARLYLQVVGLNERLKIAQLNLANAERILNVVESRFRAGAATELEVAQQRGLVASQGRVVAVLSQQLNETKVAISILLSKHVAEVNVASNTLSAIAYPHVLPGLPSQLLTRRPDIALAEANLNAANANIITARAAMLPKIQLNASLGMADDRLSGLFSNPAYSLAAGLAAPIFNAGRLAAGRDLVIAQKRELLSNYHAAIIAAFADVESVLNEINGLEKQVEWQAKELTQAKRALTLAEIRYKAGAETLLIMLDAQRTLYSAQEQSVQLLLASLQARVSLYKALGGGWSSDAY